VLRHLQPSMSPIHEALQTWHDLCIRHAQSNRRPCISFPCASDALRKCVLPEQTAFPLLSKCNSISL
jgi:hypothetical protein